jgi:hypothetical protein
MEGDIFSGKWVTLGRKAREEKNLRARAEKTSKKKEAECE